MVEQPTDMCLVRELSQYEMSELASLAENGNLEALRIFNERWSREQLIQKIRHLPGGHDQLTHGSGGGAGGRKYVKGKNLLDNELKNGNALDKKISAKASNWNVDDFAKDKFTEDEGLQEIATMQGFTGKPVVAKSKKEYDDLPSATIEASSSSAGDKIGEVHRGVKDSSTITGAKAKDEFINGDYWAGKGVDGNGYYSTENKSIAQKYTNGNPENLISFKLNPDAKITTTDDLYEMSRSPSTPESVFNDAGRFAASMGYDAIVSKSRTGSNLVIVLNRTAVVLPPGS